ncbi:unnamed protein product, partial [Ectocarpus sp. 12 AP-2014]
RDAQSRFRERSLSTSLSSSSEQSDAGRSATSRNEDGPLASARPGLLSVHGRTLTGKSASAPTMPPPPDASAFLTPRQPAAGMLPFGSPDDRGSNIFQGGDGDDETGENHDGTGGTTGGGGGGDGEGSRGGFKRGFKRMLHGVPSPSHFRRSMSFQGSMSAISSAANRVATGAMTPIRRRRERREGRKGRAGAGGDGDATPGTCPTRDDGF